ncbi:MAG: TIGR00341 family protein, partial [Thermoproteota archaeon]|nr:TIGR00341 family protein [Thermoproteota archaeon]
ERIEVTVYPHQQKEIDEVLDTFKVPYVMTNTRSSNSSTIFYIVTLPDGLSGSVIEALEPKLNTKDKLNNIAHYKAESIVSDYLRRYEEFLAEEQEISRDAIKKSEEKNGSASNSGEDIGGDHDGYLFSQLRNSMAMQSIKSKFKVKANRPIVEDLISKTDAYASRRNDIHIMVLIATVAALVGLISNSVAVIIGAMLISPLMGPFSSIALNSALGRRKEIKGTLVFSAKLVSSSILLAAAITLALHIVIPIEITPEIQSRTEEHPVGIVVAVLLGVAGGLAMITAIPEIIVGVAIAAALIPPAAVTGIGIGIGSFDVAFSAFLIFTSNTIGLVIGFMIIFLVKRIAPRMYPEKKKAGRVVKVNISILIGLAAVLAAMELIFK